MLGQRARDLTAAQTRWYQAVQGTEDVGEGSADTPVRTATDEALLIEAYARSNSLLHPRNAALMGEFIKTRNPEVWDQLVGNLKKTPQRAQTEADQAQSLAESQIVNFLTQNMGGGDYAEHMIAAGDPILPANHLTQPPPSCCLLPGGG